MKNLFVSVFFISSVILISCGGDSEEDIVVDCANSANLITSVTSTDAGCKTTNAKIEISAMAGKGNLMYQIDGGVFQSSNSFTGLGAGKYSVVVKDDVDCTSLVEQVFSGISLETDIMPLLKLECAITGCHNGANGSNRNWLVKDNVLASSGSIKSRTQSGNMPPIGSLTQSQKDIIACWVDDESPDN